METRNWSIDAYSELLNLTSQDEDKRADSLVRWFKKYLTNRDIETIELDKDRLEKFVELYYMNLEFIKSYKIKTKNELDTVLKLKKFLKH